MVPDDKGRPSGRTRQMSCSWDDDVLLNAAKDQNEFFRYCAGVAYEMKRGLGLSTGLDVRITEMELPLKKGVSSSAAVCILIAKAFNAALSLNLFPHELMEYSYQGERLTGSQCGRMDQACIYGSVPVLLVFEKSKDVRIEPIFVKQDIHLIYVDLAGQKDTVRILGDLNRSYTSEGDLQDALGVKNEQQVRLAFQMIQDGDSSALGNLMTETQVLFDSHVAPFSESQLQAPLLHELLTFDSIKDHIFGG